MLKDIENDIRNSFYLPIKYKSYESQYSKIVKHIEDTLYLYKIRYDLEFKYTISILDKKKTIIKIKIEINDLGNINIVLKDHQEYFYLHMLEKRDGEY